MNWGYAIVLCVISIDEFQKTDLRTAKILTAERVAGSEKLLRLTVDAGDQTETGANQPRQILAGIGRAYSPEDLTGRTIVIVANLEPREMMGLTSQGMLLAASGEANRPVLLAVDQAVPPGLKIG